MCFGVCGWMGTTFTIYYDKRADSNSISENNDMKRDGVCFFKQDSFFNSNYVATFFCSEFTPHYPADPAPYFLK